MAKLGIVVQSDFDQASKDLKEFKADSANTAKAVKKFQESFKGEQVDKFLDKQRLSRVALKATRGEVDASQAEYKALQREIERLIKRGIDPQDDSLKKLTKRYDQVGKEVREYTAAQKKSIAVSKKAAKVANLVKGAWAAAGLSAGLAVRAIVKNTFNVAKAGDEYAKASRRIGLTAEELQELTFVADRQGVSGEELTKSLAKLNKNVGDLRVNYGSLNTVLKNSNPELLENLKNAKSNNEAWEISVKALEDTSDELERASLAQALFGRSGIKLLTITEEGTEGIKALRQEARKYGIISNENAKQAEKFVDAQTNLTAVFKNLTNELGIRLFPVFQGIVEITTNLFKKDEDLNSVTSELIKSNREYAKITKTLADESLNLTNQEKAKLEVRKAVLKLETTKTLAKINSLFKEQKNLIPDLNRKLNDQKNLQEILSKKVKRYSRFIELSANKTKLSTKQMGLLNKATIGIAPAINAFNSSLIKSADLQLKIKTNTDNYGEALKTLAIGLKNGAISSGDLIGLNKKLRDEVISLSETIKLETNSLNDNSDAALVNFETKKEALKALKELEVTDYEERLEALKEFNLEVINSVALSEIEKKAILEKSNKEISKVEKEFRAARIKNFLDIKNLFVGIGNEISAIIANVSENQRAAAVVGKVVGVADATINTAVGVTKALREGEIAKSVLIGLLGAAQIIKIATTPVPTAQTGTGPEGLDIRQPGGRSGQDPIGLRVNDGENVNVSTRGDSGDQIKRTSISIGEEVIFDVVQRGLDNGDINITNDNIQGATPA